MGNEVSSNILESMYATTKDQQLSRTGNDAFAALKIIRNMNQQPFNQANNLQYLQAGELGRGLQQIARLIKADVGVETAFAEMGGWDHHVNEAGQMGNQLRQFSAALTAFTQDMGDKMEVAIVMVNHVRSSAAPRRKTATTAPITATATS